MHCQNCYWSCICATLCSVLWSVEANIVAHCHRNGDAVVMDRLWSVEASILAHCHRNGDAVVAQRQGVSGQDEVSQLRDAIHRRRSHRQVSATQLNSSCASTGFFEIILLVLTHLWLSSLNDEKLLKLKFNFLWRSTAILSLLRFIQISLWFSVLRNWTHSIKSIFWLLNP